MLIMATLFSFAQIHLNRFWIPNTKSISGLLPILRNTDPLVKHLLGTCCLLMKLKISPGRYSKIMTMNIYIYIFF